MKFEIDKIYDGFKLTSYETIKELEADAYVFEHVKSGAQLICLDTEDDNKVFTMSFKTLPDNHKGAAHIVEHAVCCGSAKYPLKDAFMEMDKGSLNTTLNACTYKDMTMYYAASQNEKDLLQLMEVYMDLVFHPNIYREPLLFRQEGWHYTLEELGDDMTYNGIVYNEMKGAYAEPGTYLEDAVHRALFPDTVYQYEAGGIPEEIVTLTEEDFLAFHKKHYIPSNCTICLYGNGDISKQLHLLDTLYLKDFDKVQTDFEIAKQEVPSTPIKVNRLYPMTEGDCAQKTYLNLTFVVGESVDGELRLACQVLEHILLKSAASPLLKVLVEQQKLGKSLAASGYDSGKKQPTFSISLTGCHEKDEEQFKISVFELLRTLCEDGIDRELIEAALNTMRFNLHESEWEGEAKGVVYSEDIQFSKLYGGELFEHLKYEKHFQRLVEGKDTGYFENLIKKHFLENTHYVQVTLVPSKDYGEAQTLKLQESLAAYKESLSQEQLDEIIRLGEVLEEMQEAEENQEVLDRLPSLTKEDLQEGKPPIKFEEDVYDGVKIVTTQEETHDIVYVHVLARANCVKQEDIPYVGILSSLLTYISTTTTSYDTLENKINSLTGGLSCSINAYADCKDTNKYEPIFKISAKMLSDQSEPTLKLIEEIMMQTIFNEKEKIQELLTSSLYEMERSFTATPEYRATRKVYTAFSKAAVYEDLVSGISYYHFIKQICQDFDANYSVLQDKLQTVYAQIMAKENIEVSMMCDPHHKQQVIAYISNLCKALPKGQNTPQIYGLEVQRQNTGYKITSDVQSVVQGFNFKEQGFEFTGVMYVVSTLLDTSYLWENVRLKGGAYGCESTISRDGNVLMCSYCDPQLKKTLQAFHKIGKYLKNLKLDEATLLRYIISTIGSLDYPLTLEQKSERALVHHLCHIDYEMLSCERQQVLDTSVEAIRKIGELFETMTKHDVICVIGNGNELEKNNRLFDVISSM